MRIGSRLRSSLSARISLWTVLFAAIVFIVSISVVAIRSRNAVRDEAIKGANRVLENAVLRTNYILEDVEDLAANLVEPRQVHGSDVVVVRSSDAASLAASREEAASGRDAVVCTCADVPVLLCYADCVPVVLVAPGGFAVVHSGWRGTIARISARNASASSSVSQGRPWPMNLDLLTMNSSCASRRTHPYRKECPYEQMYDSGSLYARPFRL